MDKKKQRKRKLLVWLLCVLLTVTDIIPGTGIYALADGPEMGSSAKPVPDKETQAEDAEPDAGTETGVTGETEPDTGTETGGTGETEPDAGTETDGTGETEPDAGTETDGTETGVTGETEPDAGTETDETGETEPDAGTQTNVTGETEPDDAGTQTDEIDETEPADRTQAEETDKIVTDSAPATKVLAAESAGRTLQIGKSTILTCTVSVQPAHPNYRNLSVVYDWYADPSENVDLDKNKTTCTVTAYKTGEVTVSCSVNWTYQYYDSRRDQWLGDNGHDFQGWKLTVVASDVYVTFDANGGIVDTSRKKVTCNDVYGTLPIPTKENSTFLGWYTERNGGTEVSSSTKVTKQMDHTLYAHWADHHTVTFDANGGTTPIAEKNVKNTYMYGELPSPEREGFVFDGWYTDRTGGSEITPYTIVNLTGPQTLYAHWLEIYVVTFDANGGKTPIVEKNVVNAYTYGSLPVPEREGFVFDGWYTQSDGGIQITADSTVSLSGPQTLYAHWLRIYTVTFDANGGKTPVSEKQVVDTQTYGELPEPEKDDGVFNGWYTQADGGMQITADTTASLSGPQTLYAHWLNIYTVTFDANGGETPVSEKQVVDTQTYGELPEPEKDGGIFDGWYTQEDGGIQITADTTVSLNGPQTLYAHWLRCYTVTFHALGGQVEPAAKAVLYGQNYGILPVPTREKYEFKGWYTAVQGGTQITEETIVDVEESHVLYARWGFTYTIYFDANGGQVSVESKTVSEEDCYGELPDAERDGYTFAGWYTEPTGGKRILAETAVTARDEQTLYAHWVKNCKVVFDAAGGTGAPSDMVVLEGRQAKLPAGFPTLQWKSFLGWADSYGNIYQPEDTIEVDDDMTLTARWGLNEVSLNKTYSVQIPSAGAAAYYLLKCGKETYHTFKCINAKTTSGTDMEVRIALYRQTTDSAGNAEGTQIASSSGGLTEKLDKGAEYIVALEPASSNQCGEIEFAVLESRVISYYKNESFMDYQKFSAQYADYNVGTGLYETKISPDKPSRQGWWSFIGWTTEPVYHSSRPLYKPEEKISVEEDLNLYAVWYSRSQHEESIITKMEISPGKTSSEWYSKKNYTSAAYKFTPDKSAYYRFVNADVETGLDVYIYYSNYNQITSQQTFTSVDVYMDQGVTYYIVIDNQTSGTRYPKVQVRRAYSVTYDANGGTGAPPAAYKFEGEKLSVAETCPARPFYTFDGWNTMPDGSGTSYTPGETYAADSDLTLYAVWKEERSDDATAVISGNTCSDTLTADISENGACRYFEFTPDEDGDYRFAKTGDGTISDIYMELYDSSGAKLKSDLSHGEKDGCLVDISLKAGNTYYLKTYAYDQEATGTICLELKKKYKVLYEGDGEYCTDTATGDKTGIKYHDTDMELIGADAPGRTVIYKANGGQCDISSAKISYVLEGWKREDTGEILHAGDMYTENIPVTLTTQWKTEVIPESLPQAERENYTFEGWYTEPEGGTQVTDFSALAFGENITLYAHWLPVSYTVSLDAAGGTVSPQTIDVTYGSAYGELPLATREGYVFEGWYIPRSDSKIWIGSSAIVDQSEEHTLYASWIADGAAHTVIFNAQGRCADPKAYYDIEKGSKIKEPDQPKAEGCTFTGWFQDPECTRKWDFEADTVQEDITLYAGWLVAKKVMISGIEMTSSVYNGQPASYSGEATATLRDGTDVTDLVSLTYTYSGTQADGENYEDTAEAPVNAGDYMLTVAVSGDGKDYTGSAVYRFKIRKAQLNIQADDVFLLIGEPLPDVYGYQVTGLIEGEELLEEPTLTCDAEDTETEGDYAIIPNGADAGMNYAITYQEGILTVASQPPAQQVTISGIEVADSVYNGKPVAYGGEAVAALQDGTDVTDQITFTYRYEGTQADGQYYESVAYAPANAGDYTLTVALSDDCEDYTGSAVYPFIIEKAPLNIQADDVFLVLGEPLPDDYKYHVTGLIDGEGLLKEPILTCNAENTEITGDYMIIPSGADAGMNYEITYQNGVLTVEEQLAVHKISRQTYTGTAIKPEVFVNAADSSTPLKAGEDYTVRYFNNIDADKTDANGGTNGSGTEGENGFTRELPYVVITGKGNYSGTIYQNFHIDAVSIGEKNPAKGFTFKYKNQFATANTPQKPFQSLKYKKVMKAGTDYGVKLESVTCAEDGTILTRKQVDSGSVLPAIPAGAGGIYLMTVTGMGNYRGTIEAFVYVGDKKHLMKNAKITLGKNIKSVPYDNGNPITLTASKTAGDNVFTVRFGNAYLDPVNDYTVSYQGNDAVGNATLTVTGKGMYIGTKSISFRITGRAFTAKSISVGGFKDSMAYTGESLQQDQLTLMDGSKTLVNKEHYNIIYKNNKNKGTATVTFTGNPKYGYSGSFKRTFRISAAPFNMNVIKVTATDYTVAPVGSGFRLKGESVYTKEGAKPSGRITLTDASGNVLRQGMDYTVSYRIPKGANDAIMTIKGKGNYDGFISIYYMITKAPLAQNENLTLLSVPIVLNSKNAEDYEYRPKLKIIERQKVLSAGKDYTVTAYKNCTQKSALAYLTALKNGASDEELSALRPCAEILATAAGNYTGSATVPVTIYETKLAKKDIRVEIQADTAVFTGEQVKPKVTVYYRNKKLEEERDYILTYGKNTAAGKNKGSVTVNGTGLYGGSVTQKFTIWGRDIYTVRR